MIEELARGVRRTRKPQRCYDCYHDIPAGTQANYFTGVMDGRVYTLYFHTDCRAASEHYRANMYWPDYDDGIPPLMDDINDSGEGDMIRDHLRGHFPHVVCRLELHEQKACLDLKE